jgi:hypothetical protein
MRVGFGLWRGRGLDCCLYMIFDTGDSTKMLTVVGGRDR